MEEANRMLIANIDLPTADKEYPWALPKGTQWFTLHARNGSAIRVAVESGKVADKVPPYFTLTPDAGWDERGFRINTRHGLPLYFACGTAGEVVEAFIGIHDPSLEEVK